MIRADVLTSKEKGRWANRAIPFTSDLFVPGQEGSAHSVKRSLQEIPTQNTPRGMSLDFRSHQVTGKD